MYKPQLWISHSSISLFQSCPRAYFLSKIYKDPRSQKKIQIISPALSLGLAVHDVLESLSILPTHERFIHPLRDKFETVWKTVSGKLGGFTDPADEQFMKERGLAMLQRVEQHPGPLAQKAVKIQETIPHFTISESDSIVLCGKIDWLLYREDIDAVEVIDFKTSKHEEKEDSLQLPIYTLLTTYTQSRKVVGVKYWYLERDDEPLAMPLPDLAESLEKVMRAGKQMKLAKQLEKFDCPQGEQGCMFCRPYEEILKGKGECVRETTREKVYILPEVTSRPNFDEVIL